MTRVRGEETVKEFRTRGRADTWCKRQHPPIRAERPADHDRLIRDDEHILERGIAGGVRRLRLFDCYVFHGTVQGIRLKRRLLRCAARYIIHHFQRKDFIMDNAFNNTGSAPNPLWPSTTGKKSGGKRGNAPAKGK